ncbi:hypothetical protein [Variovorax sp. J22R115]|uniref:hypothetical protein n=1 Tax=Variovorax sp. J22R115 TaxID=3053509 RepID=UPI0025763E69|nr:hypothetical protein [Variovorax sp. J22R115]MDM0053808.1 hypothetical protein [Variovorax sp. J22R115]
MSWDILNPVPPSVVYAPVDVKCHSRQDVPGVQDVAGLDGHVVSTVEERGWPVEVASICNGGDPDWHYSLEPDFEWLEHAGVAIESFLLPGDLITNLGLAARCVDGLIYTGAPNSSYRRGGWWPIPGLRTWQRTPIEAIAPATGVWLSLPARIRKPASFVGNLDAC